MVVVESRVGGVCDGALLFAHTLFVAFLGWIAAQGFGVKKRVRKVRLRVCGSHLPLLSRLLLTSCLPLFFGIMTHRNR